MTAFLAGAFPAGALEAGALPAVEAGFFCLRLKEKESIVLDYAWLMKERERKRTSAVVDLGAILIER